MTRVWPSQSMAPSWRSSFRRRLTLTRVAPTIWAISLWVKPICVRRPAGLGTPCCSPNSNKRLASGPRRLRN